MSYLNKNYKFVKQENFDGFLRAVGLPEEKIAQVVKFAPDQKLVQDGDSYTYITNGRRVKPKCLTSTRTTNL